VLPVLHPPLPRIVKELQIPRVIVAEVNDNSFKIFLKFITTTLLFKTLSSGEQMKVHSQHVIISRSCVISGDLPATGLYILIVGMIGIGFDLVISI
jgi:hypothetical protein